MNKLTKKILLAAAKTVAAVAIILLLWWMFAAVTNNELILPSPWEVLRLTFRLLGDGKIYIALLWTLLRALAAFAVSAAVGVGLVLLAGVCAPTRPYVNGIVTFFRAVPTIAIILVAMVAFNSALVPVVVAFLVAFPVMYSAFYREITADVQLEQICKIYDVSAVKKVKYVLLPQVARSALPQCKDSFPLCVKVVIAGEVMALPRMGLGHDMYVAKVNLLTANVLALTLLALAVCFAVSGAISLVQRRVKL